MEAYGLFINGVISPLSWVPAFGLALLLRRQVWWRRTLAAMAVSLVAGLAFALLVTPDEPKNVLTLIGLVLASALWSVVFMLVVLRHLPGWGD